MAGAIIAEHFRLLQTFGKNDLQRKANDREREAFWKMCCEGGNVPYVPHEQVVDAWKEFVTANSKDSGLAVSGVVDPTWVSFGITFKKKIIAGHTTRMEPLLKRLLTIYKTSFKSREAFLEAMEKLCRDAAP